MDRSDDQPNGARQELMDAAVAWYRANGWNVAGGPSASELEPFGPGQPGERDRMWVTVGGADGLRALVIPSSVANKSMSLPMLPDLKRCELQLPQMRIYIFRPTSELPDGRWEAEARRRGIEILGSSVLRRIELPSFFNPPDGPAWVVAAPDNALLPSEPPPLIDITQPSIARFILSLASQTKEVQPLAESSTPKPKRAKGRETAKNSTFVRSSLHRPWVLSALNDLTPVGDAELDLFVVRVVNSTTDDLTAIRAWWARSGAPEHELNELLRACDGAVSPQEYQKFLEYAQSAGWRFAWSGKKHKYLVFLCLSVPDFEDGIYAMPSACDEAATFLTTPIRPAAWLMDDATKEHQIILELMPRHGRKFAISIDQSMLGDSRQTLFELLAGKGCEVPQERELRACVVAFISATKPSTATRTVSQPGWYGDAFVSMSETFVAPDAKAEVFLSASLGGRAPESYQCGTLEGWQRDVAGPALSSRAITLALIAQFAAPIGAWLGLPLLGIHFFGNSSIGKTTALRVSASVSGPAHGYQSMLRTWHASEAGFETMAIRSNHHVLLLDEVGQAPPQALGQMLYTAANGSGKKRSNRHLQDVPEARWSTLPVSTGETHVADQLSEQGATHHLGQEVRLLQLPADAGSGLGIFDSLMHAQSPRALADELNEATKCEYGTAFPPFMRRFLKAVSRTPSGEGYAKKLRDRIRRFQVDMVGKRTDPVIGRVAGFFALLAVAGELATYYGITGWPVDTCFEVVRRAFERWLVVFDARPDPVAEKAREAISTVQGLITSGAIVEISSARASDEGVSGWTKQDLLFIPTKNISLGRVGEERVNVIDWLCRANAMFRMDTKNIFEQRVGDNRYNCYIFTLGYFNPNKSDSNRQLIAVRDFPIPEE